MDSHASLRGAWRGLRRARERWAIISPISRIFEYFCAAFFSHDRAIKLLEMALEEMKHAKGKG
jgi:hypothetical protein